MSTTNPFTPSAAGTLTVSATTSNSSVQLAANDTRFECIRIANAGTGTAFVVWGVGAQTASPTTSMPILAGTVEVFSKGLADTVGVISSSTSTVYLTCGEGQ